MIRNEGVTTPRVAAIPPNMPACWKPINVAVLIANGPGVDSDIAKKFKISVVVIQPFALQFHLQSLGSSHNRHRIVNNPILKKTKKQF